MTTVTIDMIVHPEKFRELQITLAEIRDELKTWRGFLDARTHNNNLNPDAMIFVEEWETEDDLNAYMKSDTFSVLKGALKVLSHSASIEVSTTTQNMFDKEPA